MCHQHTRAIQFEFSRQQLDIFPNPYYQLHFQFHRCFSGEYNQYKMRRRLAGLRGPSTTMTPPATFVPCLDLPTHHTLFPQPYQTMLTKMLNNKHTYIQAQIQSYMSSGKRMFIYWSYPQTPVVHNCGHIHNCGTHTYTYNG